MLLQLRHRSALALVPKTQMLSAGGVALTISMLDSTISPPAPTDSDRTKSSVSVLTAPFTRVLSDISADTIETFRDGSSVGTHAAPAQRRDGQRDRGAVHCCGGVRDLKRKHRILDVREHVLMIVPELQHRLRRHCANNPCDDGTIGRRTSELVGIRSGQCRRETFTLRTCE
eukprot:616672-Rhodomonas_salina.2